MTEDEFKAGYTKHSQLTIAEFDKWLQAVPCDCGEEGCEGWKAIVRPNMMTMLRTRRIYDVSKE